MNAASGLGEAGKVGTREPVFFWHGVKRLDRELRTTLPAAANQDVLSGSAGRTRAETVCADTLALLWLPVSFGRHAAHYTRIPN